jgi:hypothetical protein
MSSQGQSRRAIRLADADNVAVVTADLRPGAVVEVAGRRIEVLEPIPFGHKIALDPIAAGARVTKFGVPIGIAVTAIRSGAHVHVHNLKSDYINNAVDHFDA